MATVTKNDFTIPGALKAYISLLGASATALLALFTADTPVGKVLTVVAVLATTFGVWVAQNSDAPTAVNQFGYAILGTVGAVLLVGAVILLLTTLLKVFVVAYPVLVILGVIGIVLILLDGRTGARRL